MGPFRHAITSYTQQGMYSFHTPGHKGRKDQLDGILIAEYDLTELPGLDNLHNPQGVIALAQKEAAEVFGAEETFFLVNGATAGNQAMFLALAQVSSNKKLLIDRRAHRSVFGGLVLSGLVPEYICPIIHPEFNLALGLDIKHVTNCFNTLTALHVTSPSYYGTLLDMEHIVCARDKEAPNVPIFVDQAHGSHHRGELFPKSALEVGADVVLHSTHKTLGALTQAAMLHCKGNRINKTFISKSLETLQTSSPSYLLMASLEKALEVVQNIHWDKLWEDLYIEVKGLQDKLQDRLRILTKMDTGRNGIVDVDWSKILINVSTLRISAPEVVQILRKSFSIEPELWDQKNILFILGIGSKPEEVRYLREALEQIVIQYFDGNNISTQALKNTKTLQSFEIPPLRVSPREAWFKNKKRIDLKTSVGKIAGETISVYPPGIPLITAGEEITPYVYECLACANDFNWVGWEGIDRGEILVLDL